MILKQAIEIRPDVANYIGRIAQMINDAWFSPLVMGILRLGRLVGIPKTETSVRPITLTSFFAKLTGGLVFDACKPTCSRRQFAIKVKNGCERIIHNARKEYQEGNAVIRFDIQNAFGTAQRGRIAQLIDAQNENGKLDNVRRYFNVMPGPSATLVIFGRSGCNEWNRSTSNRAWVR